MEFFRVFNVAAGYGIRIQPWYEYFHLGENPLEIEVTPEVPYCLSTLLSIFQVYSTDTSNQPLISTRTQPNVTRTCTRSLYPEEDPPDS